ncbi:MAG: tetratricopeptide repeat protein [Planctomycetota bacterium]|jgi:tetratricopeptide (TPR) repeat protein
MAKTKKELKEDAFVEFFHDAIEKVRPYANVVLAVLVIVVVLVAVWVTIAARDQMRERNALDALARAETKKQLTDLPPAYLETAAGPRILFALADKLRAEVEEDGVDNSSQLIGVYRQLLELEPPNDYRLRAHMALGVLLVDSGEHDKAIEEFQAAAGLPLTYRQAEAIWYTGWCLEKLDRPNEALEHYQRIARDLVSRVWREQADFRISQIKKSLAGR